MGELNIMKRKVIKQGNGTLTITLPKGWTKNVGLKGGDEIDVDDSGKGLMINTDAAATDKRIDIELESNNKIYVQQILRNIYLSGYDEVYVRFFDLSSIACISREIDDLLGYQIIEQSKDSCLIKNLSPVVDEQFSALLRRIFLLNQNLSKILIEDLKEGRLKSSESVKEISRTIYRFANYCRRTITKKMIFDDYEGMRMYILITKMMTYSNDIRYIYERMLGRKKLNLSKECLDYVKKVCDYYDMFYNLYYDRNLKEIHKISVIKNELLNKELPNLIRKNGDNNLMIYYAADMARTIASNGGILFTLKRSRKS